MARITIRDIAEALKVSPSTVSKALSDSHEISETTKQRVLKYARNHDYVPNRFARNLRKGKTNTIGVIASNISNTFISQVLQSIHTNFEKKGIYTLITQSHFDETTERKGIENLVQRGVDGILISPVHVNSNQNLLEKIQKSHPVVLFDRIESSLQTYKVGVDNENGGFLATRHLLRNGRRNIVFVMAKGLGISYTRLEGYKNALKKYNVPFKKENVLEVNLGGYKALDEEITNYFEGNLKSKKSIDAVVCASETISTRSLGLFAEMGIKIPSQIAVVGFANTSFAFSLNPPLTTIVQPAEKMGEIAAQKTLELLKNPTVSIDEKRIELKNKLEIRKSCGYALK